MYITYLLRIFALPAIQCKGAYIKYVGVGAGGFYKFFKKIFVA